jgi:hypothetical protein
MRLRAALSIILALALVPADAHAGNCLDDAVVAELALQELKREIPDWKPYPFLSKEYSDAQNLKVRTAIASVARQIHLSPAQKNRVWSGFVEAMRVWSQGKWEATPYRGADGSYIWWGVFDIALVIAPNGDLYRGRLFRTSPPTAEFVPDYPKMTLIEPPPPKQAH